MSYFEKVWQAILKRWCPLTTLFIKPILTKPVKSFEAHLHFETKPESAHSEEQGLKVPLFLCAYEPGLAFQQRSVTIGSGLLRKLWDRAVVKTVQTQSGPNGKEIHGRPFKASKIFFLLFAIVTAPRIIDALEDESRKVSTLLTVKAAEATLVNRRTFSDLCRIVNDEANLWQIYRKRDNEKRLSQMGHQFHLILLANFYHFYYYRNIFIIF